MSQYLATEHRNEFIPHKENHGSLKDLKDIFDLKILNYSKANLQFEIHNLPSDYNGTLRRIILDEVASVAFDRIYLLMNTGCTEDTDLQLRFGLIPIDLNPDLLDFYSTPLPNELTNFEPNSCLLFELNVNFNKLRNINLDRFQQFSDPFNKQANTAFAQKYASRLDRSYYSDDLIWCPLNGQETKFSNPKPIENILIGRLMPGEEVIMKALAVKGYGHDHAKFNPVSSAYGYRAHKIKLLEPITGKSAIILQSLYPEGVIKLKNGRAFVGNTRLLKRSNKNFYEYEDLRDKVEISFDESVFIWNIESVRPTNQPSHMILNSAFQSMIEKCTFYKNNIDKLQEESKKTKEGGIVNYKLFSGKVCGKNCYIEKVFQIKDYPNYRFYGENATLGVSLSYMMNYLYGEKITCAYTDIQGGMELVLYNFTRNPTDQILKEGLNSLSEYFQFMQETFKLRMEMFHSNDVNME